MARLSYGHIPTMRLEKRRYVGTKNGRYECIVERVDAGSSWQV